MTREEIDALCEALRERHAELRKPLTWHSIQRVLRRARIRYQRVPLDAPAVLLTHAGVSVILLNSDLPPRSHTEAMAHELSHILLHAGEPSELVYHLWRPNADDPREMEADYLTRCLLAGPDAEVVFPTRRGSPAAAPTRQSIFLWKEGTLRDPYLHPYQVGLGPWPLHASEARGPRIRRRVTKDKLLPGEPAIVYGQLFGPTFYRDREGMKWEMHDVTVDMNDGRIVRLEVDLGSPRALYRYFIGPTERRSYRFSKWEQRDVKPKHLERQMRESTVHNTRQHKREKRA